MDQSTKERLYAAIGMYNRGDYLNCQETLEQVYAESGESDRPLVHALIMLSCAMHLHFKRGGGRGVVNLLERSLLTLDDLRPESLGVNVGELYAALESYHDDLQERRRPGAGFFDRWLAPRVRYTRTQQ